jgi:hypothetical protein
MSSNGPAVLQLDFDAFYALAVYHYDPEDQGETGFKEGDVLRIVGENEFGWWLGQNTKGELGWVPSNFFKVVDESTVDTAAFDATTKFLRKTKSRKELNQVKNNEVYIPARMPTDDEVRVEIGKARERSQSRGDEEKRKVALDIERELEKQRVEKEKEAERQRIEQEAKEKELEKQRIEAERAEAQRKLKIQRAEDEKERILAEAREAERLERERRLQKEREIAEEMEKDRLAILAEKERQKEQEKARIDAEKKRAKELELEKEAEFERRKEKEREIQKEKSALRNSEVPIPSIGKSRSPNRSIVGKNQEDIKQDSTGKGFNFGKLFGKGKGNDEDEVKVLPLHGQSEHMNTDSILRSNSISQSYSCSATVMPASPTQEFCPLCSKSLLANTGVQVRVAALDYQMIHMSCFKCFACQKSLTGEEEPKSIGKKLYCSDHFNELSSPLGAVVCARCSKPVIGSLLRAMGKSWHRECFQCSECSKLISLDRKFHRLPSDVPACADCYAAKHAPTCSSCSQPITTGLVVRVLEKKFHQECFVCPIGNHPMSTASPLRLVNGILCCTVHAGDLLLRLEAESTAKAANKDAQ